ncbi:MAG: hypothetical protein U0822_22210 [Anaerolineae bacterium]
MNLNQPGTLCAKGHLVVDGAEGILGELLVDLTFPYQTLLLELD